MPEELRQLDHGLNVRQRSSVFPFGNGLMRNVHGSRQLLLRHSLCLSQACDGFSDGAIVNHFSFLRFALEWMANPFTMISIALSNSDCKQLKVEFIESRLNSAVLLALFFVECQKSLDKSSQKD